MSLLVLKDKSRLMEFTQKIFKEQFEIDKKLDLELSERRKRLMMQDIYYNIDALDSAVVNNSEEIMIEYTKWLIGLLTYRMKDLGLIRVKEQMETHFVILKKVLEEDIEDKAYVNKALVHIDNSIEIIKEFQLVETNYLDNSKYRCKAEEYLKSLISRDKQKSSKVILDAVKEQVPIEEIYTEIFNPVMKEIGNLWYKNEISVDKEHYATAVTQGVMAQLYSRIFSTPRNGKTMVALCVGNELHEMGIRMLCDLFELKGWDTVYLGAAVPTESINDSLDEYNPDLLLLSVTMPNYLEDCKELINKIRGKNSYNDIKIAVGGRAFDLSPKLRDEWQVDIKSSSYKELISWTEKNL